MKPTSKWVKNSHTVTKIADDIIRQHDGKFPSSIHGWIRYCEIGPKSAALILWAGNRLSSTVPVDSHVLHAIPAWNWTTANPKDPDEISRQLGQWLPPQFFIPLNDAIGSIRQVIKAECNLPKRVAYEYRGTDDSFVIDMINAL